MTHLCMRCGQWVETGIPHECLTSYNTGNTHWQQYRVGNIDCFSSLKELEKRIEELERKVKLLEEREG